LTSTFTYTGLGSVLSASGFQPETYTRDPLGNALTRMVSAPTWSGTYTNTYDQHSTRLKTSVGALGFNHTDSYDFVYDAVGNLVRTDQLVMAPPSCGSQINCGEQPQTQAWSHLYTEYRGDGRVVQATRTTSNDNL